MQVSLVGQLRYHASRVIGAGPVKAAALWLEEQGIHCDVDFIGLCDLALLPEAELLPAQALEFLESLTSDAAVKMMQVKMPSKGQASDALAPSSAPATKGLFQEDSVSLDISGCTPSEALKRLSDTVNNIGQENW